MNPTPIITGLLHALATCPAIPKALVLNREAMDAVRSEIMSILQVAKEMDDLDLARKFEPVMVNGIMHPAVMGVPFFLTPEEPRVTTSTNPSLN